MTYTGDWFSGEAPCEERPSSKGTTSSVPPSERLSIEAKVAGATTPESMLMDSSRDKTVTQVLSLIKGHYAIGLLTIQSAVSDLEIRMVYKDGELFCPKGEPGTFYVHRNGEPLLYILQRN